MEYFQGGQFEEPLPERKIFTRKNILFGVLGFSVILSVGAFLFLRGAPPVPAPTTSITIPEGFDSYQIADVAGAKLKNFNRGVFLALATPLEGRLFPDTYFFYTFDTEVAVVQKLHENFKKKISALEGEILATGKTENDIIIMASLIERESKGDSDRELISGILWKRLKLGMRLQVDAAPNTYQTKGLPAAPIANPGLAAITAALRPTESAYLYYLHDKKGNTYYAKTFAEHRANIEKYLK